MSDPLSDALTVGSLFSGIGGLDLGLERAGMRVIWQSEIDPYASRVLAKHWPTIPNLGDITTIDWSTVERPDLICGGYPCQPFSFAGSRSGENDVRHLWPHALDAIRHLRPRYALLENVPGHLSMGFGRVLGDLAECGYDCEWDCIPAAAVGAPHLRYRVFIVAHTDEYEHKVCSQAVGWTATPELSPHTDRGGESSGPVDAFPRSGVMVPDADGSGRTGRDGGPTASVHPEVVGDPDRPSADAHSTPGRPRGTVGESGWWAVEPDVGRVADGVPARMDRLKCLGNAVVPQVAEHIGRQLIGVFTDAR